MALNHPQLLLSLLSLYLASLAYGATLAKDEVDALKQIGKKLGKEWNFSVDPCSGRANWLVDNETNAVFCDENCTLATDNGCHVVRIILKEQSLQGMLPPDLVRLPYLKDIDLTRNYLNGTIPKEWGSLKVVNISLGVNRLSGSLLPITTISTLKNFTIESNRFSGKLPPELGKLTQIEKMHLTSNNFSGELPEELARLTSLKDIRLSDNQFTGKIPDFIQNWTSLEKLVIQGSGLSGPIPPAISSLKNLTDLRISDLNGPDSTFPQLNDTKGLNQLILRSCNIKGELPGYLGEMKNLKKTLDLSFNKLSGQVPTNFYLIRKVDNMYLTGNLLTGPLPEWRKQADSVDLSYNNFIGNQGLPCQEQQVNLFASSSNRGSNKSIAPVSCLKSTACSTAYSFYINCGGQQVTIRGKTYEADISSTGSATFIQGGANWVLSSTGHFLDDDKKSDSYTYENKSRMSVTSSAYVDAELYKNARFSAISLTYYGFCLASGNYTVRLHFTEIMFTNDSTYLSLGRRLFDVYIQGVIKLKNFNIAEEAGGAGKEVVKNFSVAVNNTIEIHLRWTGKGTTNVPYRSVYGPLISAISVENDNPPHVNSISTGAVVGIVAAGVIIIILLCCILWWKGCLGKTNSLAREIKSLDLQMSLFSFRQIKVATNNFDIANKIGEGGFGPVYKGVLSDGIVIAVKQLSSKSKQGNREFINEIGMISALQHPCLVKLYGCCVEGDQLLLVYEYMENNSLARALFGAEESQIKLDWPTRQKICIGIARGLAFLHEESRLKIVHRDIKATNVLLDKDLNPKISDFGLAKLDEEDNTHISTKIAGTYGYMAPEYAMHGYLTDKADVYSFGIVALEIISGKSNTTQRPKEQSFYLLDWANLLKGKGNLLELVDRRLGSDYNQEEAMIMIKVALLCTHITAACRPAMSLVLSMLEGRIGVEEDVPDSSEVLDEKKMEAMRQHYQQIEEIKITNGSNPTHSFSTQGPWTNSSTSAADLYPISINSSFWEKRN